MKKKWFKNIKAPLKLYDAKENIIIIGHEKTSYKSYITISHRWNDDDKIISINNLDKYKKLDKIKNIYIKNNNLRYFWIDTICID